MTLLLLSCLLVFLLLLFVLRAKVYKSHLLPNGDRRNPLVARYLVWKFGKNKLGLLEHLANKYDGLFEWEGIVYTCNPSNILARGSCNTDYHKALPDPIAQQTVGNSFITLEEAHKERKQLSHFLKRAALKDYAPIIAQLALDSFDSLERERTDNELPIKLEAYDYFHRLTLRIILDTLFALKLEPLEEDELLHSMAQILRQCLAFGAITPHSLQFAEAVDTVNRLAERIAKACPSNTLGSSLGVNPDTLRDNVKLFLLAGSETSASTLTFCCHLLSAHPGWQDKIRDELEADETFGPAGVNLAKLDRCPWLDCFLKETLRLYPTAPFVTRQTSQKTNIGGYEFPAQTPVRVFIWGQHRNASVYRDPMKFKPERWREPREQENYFPFSKGKRVCLGQEFAVLEMKIILALLLRRYHVQSVLPPGRIDDRIAVDWLHAVTHPRPLHLLFVPRVLSL